ncbi:glycogen synthase [Arachidicoccus ginsenosidimutans]|uniref:glycogen synthase n=1 Tax=Arachidicoccus sp. BS20 TaxID=1850526 RepID=UPI0007F0E47D|nr:glycogen synthase [Arachidicoccus sp. BS20]ANI88971.1 glycogen synthase [Arachidicoccus sp. BS20]
MEILHVTAECYPVAKAGGLGDVAGALPKYEQHHGHNVKLIMPYYSTKFVHESEWETDYTGRTNLGDYFFSYKILKEKTNKLGFTLYLVEIHGLLDRPKIYGYDDDAQRFIAFQICVANWLRQWHHKPGIVHCHDYHAGLLPFIFKYCYDYNSLSDIPTILTIHNAEYQGWLDWNKSVWLPRYDLWKTGLLEWNNVINPLASGIKNAWAVTTVSPSYMRELRHNSNGLEDLFEYEKGKCTGILNGIDTELWNPKTDTYIEANYDIAGAAKGKQANKEVLCNEFGLNIEKPLFIFIGRLVGEKAADVLPDAVKTILWETQQAANFLVLGSGDPFVEDRLEEIKYIYPESYNFYKGYNERLSHQMYAGADFLLMPSRVEPCGLNQMYSLRYGTMPLVRRTGGLIDTVIDIGDAGYGICFNHANIEDIKHAVNRAIGIYQSKKMLYAYRKKMMQIDNSWDNTVEKYIDLYQQFIS